MTARRTLVRLATCAVAVAATVSLGALSPASAAEGSIDHVETKGDQLQVLYSVPGAGETAPDLDSVKISLGDTELDATAQPASEAQGTVRRTTMLAIDVSNSMAGAKFAAAKQAAQVFLSSVPADLYVGIVTFAGKVTVLQQPSLD